MTGLAVRAIDLDELDPGPSQMAGQAGTIGAGALHADERDGRRANAASRTSR